MLIKSSWILIQTVLLIYFCWQFIDLPHMLDITCFAKNNLQTVKVDGTSFSDAGSLVTTAHLTREICPRDLKYRKSKTNMGTPKLLLTRCFFSCLSEIGSKQKLSFGRQLLSNSVCVRKTLFVAQRPKFKARVSISVAINLDRDQ